MATNPILNELHAIRREYAERFNQDLHALCEDARRKQGRHGRSVVAAPSREAIEKDKVDQVPDLLQLDLKNKSPLIKNKPTLAP